MSKDAKAIKERLEKVRGQLLNWEQSDPHGTVAGFTYSSDSYRGQTREELRGWEHALVWVLKGIGSIRNLPEREDNPMENV